MKGHCYLYWSRQAGSNRWPTLYESVALPTELCRQHWSSRLPENSKVAHQSQLQMRVLHYLFLLFFLLGSCSGDGEEQKKSPTPKKQHVVQQKGCRSCHDKQLDSAHDFPCTTCHGGDNSTAQKEVAHVNLIAEPAHPDNMVGICGKCHADQVKESAHSLHFTLNNEVNLVRNAFGAQEDLNSLIDIPIAQSPTTSLELADDLLRRRCLRCHVYYKGDRYPAIVHGSGCAACHLSFYEGKLTSHAFIKTPDDLQCLQCHYGNHVGADYHGRFDHDMNEEYRTPYTTRNTYFRPYGMEYHQLQKDIHQEKGLLCVDCHYGDTLMGDTKSITCEECHNKRLLKQKLPHNVSKTDDGSFLLLSSSQKSHPLITMDHPAHQKYGNQVACQVCHATWTFNDEKTSLLRSDLDEYEDFSRLTVQGSFEIEKILLNNLDYEAEEVAPVMRDKITKELRPGLWHKGYTIRRWEDIPLGRDNDGIIQVMRPILDLELSWIDENQTVHFDAVQAGGESHGMLPYVPHTTGKAGLFYEKRIRNFLESEKKTTTQ